MRSMVSFSFSAAARMRSISPPGSITAAFFVCVHQTIEQFCCKGVTGTTATRSVGAVLSPCECSLTRQIL
jgi:hypothetical protein